LLRPTDGRARVWRQRNTSFQDNHMLGTTAFGGGGVTVWGCFSFDCKLDLSKAVVPNMWLSWNEVFRWRQTLARPSVGRNKKRLSSDQQCSWTTTLGRIEPELYIFLTASGFSDNSKACDVARYEPYRACMELGRNKKRLSSDQWTRLHVRIVHPKWSYDQSNRAWRWRNVNCGRFMGRHARILVRLMQRFRQTGNVTDRPRAGRPRKTTPREDRLISRRARQRPFSTAGALRGNLAFGGHISTPSVIRRLHHQGMRARWPIKRSQLTLRHRHAIKNVQVQLIVKEKQPQTVTPPPPIAVVPKMWLSWNEVFRWPVDPSPCATSPPQMIMCFVVI
jgi:transposase